MTTIWPVRVLAATVIAAAVFGGVVRVVQGSTSAAQALLFAVVAAAYIVVGAIIIERRRGNVVGPVLLSMGTMIAAYLIADAFLRQPNPPSGAAVIAWAVTLIDAPLFTLIGILFLVFPDGRIASRRWRYLAGFGIASAVIWVIGITLTPGVFTFYSAYENPFGQAWFPGEAITAPLYLTGILFVVVSAFSLVGRWRRGGLVERAQLKWVAVAAAIIGFTMVSYGTIFGPGQFNEAADVAVGMALGFFAVAIGIAILRYHLFEIDRIISRTLAYAVVLAILGVVFAGGILLLQAVLTRVTQGETVAVAASTLVVFALFQPVLRRVRHAVDRRFDRAAYDAERTVSAFSERLRGQMEMETVTDELTRTVGLAVAPSDLAIWLRSGRADR